MHIEDRTIERMAWRTMRIWRYTPVVVGFASSTAAFVYAFFVYPAEPVRAIFWLVVSFIVYVWSKDRAALIEKIEAVTNPEPK